MVESAPHVAHLHTRMLAKHWVSWISSALAISAVVSILARDSPGSIVPTQGIAHRGY